MVLRTTTINSNIEGAAEYYTHEECYYSQDEDEQEMTASENFGKLAPKKYSKRSFTKLFNEGKLPNGQRIRNDHHSGVERLCYDLTFCVPGKSLSLAIHGPNGDKRLWDAHVEALKETLKIIEEEYAAARVQKGGVREIIKTGNIAATLVHHHESRAGDPSVHTHVVLFNGTECPDGEHRALYIEPLIQSRVLGQIYTQKYALKVQQLGYQIRETKVGFELEGVTQKQLENFSKRTTEIDDYLKAHGMEKTAANRQKAVLLSRTIKDATETLGDKRERWQSEMAEVNYMGITPAPHPITPENQETPRELLDVAIRHFSQRQTSFSSEDIQRFVFSHLRSFDEKPLKAEIKTHPELITAWDGRFTTQSAVERDLRIIDAWLAGNQSVKALNPNADFRDTILKPGQAEAMRRLLSGTDQFQIIKGLAGTGKSTAVAIAKKKAEVIASALKDVPSGIKVKVYASTHTAKDEIGEKLGVLGETTAHLALAKVSDEPNQLWIIDESGMIGAEDFDGILQKAKAVGARIWFIGDTGQNSSISAGAPLKLMMHNGATVHRIDQIIRQQDQQQNKAVQLIAQGHSLEALDVLEKARCIHECATTDHKISAAVDHFMNLPYRKGRPLVVVGTNAEREEFTDQLRLELLAAGRLKHDTEYIQLKDRNLSNAQKDRAENYNKGDLISFRIKHRLYTQIKTHVPYKVLGIEGKKLSVQSPGGRILKLDPGEFEGKEVYTAHRSSIAEGDYLRFTSTHRQKGIYANTSLKCTKIKKGIATVEDRQGNIHDLNLSKPLKLDHDWATTAYRSQGTTNAHTIYISSSTPHPLENPSMWGISRQTHKLAIFTEDINRLRGWITQSFAQENAVDLLSDPHAGWKPNYEGIERPHHLDERTWKEMQESGIHPSLLTQNHLRSVAPDQDMDIRNNPLVSALLEREFDKSRYGAGQEVTKKMQAKLNGITKVDGQWVADPKLAYSRIAEGGGWIGYGGTDLFSVIHGGSTPSEYCQVKPYTPRIIDGDEVKYETSKGVDQQVFLPDIPDEIAELIYKRNAINPTPEERAKGAWFVADKYNLPIVLAEGLKKTWASLSQGHLTVGLPGVNALYRAKDEFDNRLEFRN